jgi:hypothetical protein
MNELFLRRKPSQVTETGLLTPVNCVVAFAKTLSGDNNFGLGSVKQSDPRLRSFRISRELRVEGDRYILAVLVQSRVFAGEGAGSFQHIGIRKPLRNLGTKKRCRTKHAATLASGRDRRNQLRTACIANTRRRNE